MPDQDREPRLIHRRDRFTGEELARGEVVLEVVQPVPEPDEEPDEPWGRIKDLPARHRIRRWVQGRLGHGDST